MKKTNLSDYEIQAINFLRDNNAKMTITFKTMSYSQWDNDNLHNIYRIRIDRNHKTFSFDFTDSVYNTRKNNRPEKYNILACLTKYEVGSFEDFCLDFGYKISPEFYEHDNYIKTPEGYFNKESYKAYKAVKKEYNNVYRLFSDCMDQLQAIE